MTKIFSLLIFFFFSTTLLMAQMGKDKINSDKIDKQQIENIIIITTDGLRWQEVFTGMDSAIAHNKKYHEGKEKAIFEKYWNDDATVRRKLLFPFLWGTLAQKGRIYGNRHLESYVNVSNPYWFSYPGYSEIFCGFVDTAINTNSYPPNPHVNVLEYINAQPGYKNKVAAFGAWNAFDRILNEERSGIPVASAYDNVGGAHPTEKEQLINAMRSQSYQPMGMGECPDVFTHFGAWQTLEKNDIKVLYIAYGETDEFAHEGKYYSYLEAAHRVDQYLKELWEYVHSQPKYKNKTALLITVDHGRGDIVKDEWTSHGKDIEGADQIWFAVMGPGISAEGEMQHTTQIYQKQFAQTIANLLGLTFKAEHPIAESVDF